MTLEGRVRYVEGKRQLCRGADLEERGVERNVICRGEEQL